MTKAEAEAICGTLGTPSKMPGYAYGLPAIECKAGSQLRKIEGSVCSKCYAMKGHYTFENVAKSQYKRLRSLDHPLWVEAVATLIKLSSCLHFRWHDSGDLQSQQHLVKIIQVARLLPKVRFWLPTRELAIVRRYKGEVPKNLCIRVSATMIDNRPPKGFRNTSTVHSQERPIGHACPARSQGNVCGTCRACWDRRVLNIGYERH